MIVRVEVIFPKGNKLVDVDTMAHAIESALDKGALLAKKDFEKTTNTWNKKPEFRIEREIGTRLVHTTDDIYFYVSEGTKVRRVIMTPGFSPKTSHRVIGSAAGAGGVMVGPSKKINRPGIKAREFAEAVAEKWEPEMPKMLQGIINAEADRA